MELKKSVNIREITMKKFLSVFICIILLLSPLNIDVFAESNIKLNINEPNVAAGSNFTVTANLTGDIIAADRINLTVTCSPEIKLVSASFAGIVEVSSSLDSTPASVSAVYPAPFNFSGNFLTLTFLMVSPENAFDATVNFSFISGGSEIYNTTGSFGKAADCARHTFSEWQTITEATCQVDGVKTRYCTNCGKSENDTIPKTEHFYQNKEILRNPTCTAPGYQRGYCIYCQQKLLEEIAPISHVMGTSIIVTAPSCLAKGLNETACVVCGYKEYTETDAIGHNMGAWQTIIAATCNEGGSLESTCLICGHKEYTKTDAIGHNMGAWQTITAATCDEGGSLESTCLICGYKEYKVSYALGHTMGEWVIVKPASCTENGLKEKACSYCGLKENEEIAAIGHKMGEWFIETEASCTVKEVKAKVCANCSMKETEEGEALGHKFKEAVVTTEPTIGKYGIKTGYCERCDETTEADVECAYTDKETNIHIDTTHGVFPENAKTKIQFLKEGSSDYKTVKEALAHITNQFYGYSIDITNLGFTVSPEGEASVTFPVPEKFGKRSAFYYINSDGTVKKLSADFSKDGKTATVKFIDSGRYAICRTQYAAGTEFISPATVNGRLIIVIASLILVICWAIVILSIIKQKNPKLYKKIKNFFPTFSEIKNLIKRNIFIISEKIKKPH